MQPFEMQKSVSVQVYSDFVLFLPSGAYEIKKMESRSKLRKVILFCLLLSLFGMVAFGYFCPEQVCPIEYYIIFIRIITKLNTLLTFVIPVISNQYLSQL